MSPTVLMAIFVLACDLLIFVFFRWTFREKYRTRARRVCARKRAAAGGSSNPDLVGLQTSRHGRDTDRKVA
jgi:hypothetical protein